MKKVARELVAAAQRWTARRFRTAQPDQTWQHRAWSYYDNTPEVRFAATWIGNAMGKARLFAGVRDKDGTVTPLPDSHRASELVASIAGGPAGQSELLSGFGPHLVVAGEGWIVIRPIEDARTGQVRGEDWRVLSVLEMSSKGQSLEAEIDGDLVEIPPHDPSKPDDPMAPVAIRVWDAHPRRHIEADSPIRSSLTLLEELRLLNAAVAAIARSRLTGRGVLLVPHGTRFPTKGGATLDGEEDDLLEVFMQVAETAYKDPESAAAAVPIILEVPADAIGKIERLTFESDFDDLAMRLREETIRRFATGLDTPAEILLGTGEVNHWGGWQLKEEAITLAVEPRLGTVADALTTQWLRPILEDEGADDAGEVLVWYDSSTLRVRANRPQTALEVHDRGAISDAALRRETGFDDDDAPDQEELAARRQRNGLGENPADQERLPVDESQAIPDTLPAAATPLPQGDPVAAAAWVDVRGRELAEQLKAQHGLNDEELSDLLYAMCLTRVGARHGG
ncbi:hypothetical protein AB0F88_16905 [Streptosporangium sp. NPDC023963]|uniref:hypothetical protein n=1 Tax=Streptosporangium sp. NPDC023963 TaxID=3155608 RepID=UPI00343C98CF